MLHTWQSLGNEDVFPYLRGSLGSLAWMLEIGKMHARSEDLRFSIVCYFGACGLVGAMVVKIVSRRHLRKNFRNLKRFLFSEYCKRGSGTPEGRLTGELRLAVRSGQAGRQKLVRLYAAVGGRNGMVQ